MRTFKGKDKGAYTVGRNRNPTAKKGRKIRPYTWFGANGQIRTDGLFITNELLYRLSHISIICNCIAIIT